MRLFRAMDSSASGLTAERLRLELIANNIANANTTRTPEGGPYRRQVAIFAPRQSSGFAALLARWRGRAEAPGEGVRVVGVMADQAPTKRKHDPGHPDADAEGYVEYPNVDVVTEMVDMISATRAYEANVKAIEAAKTMALRALEIGRG